MTFDDANGDHGIWGLDDGLFGGGREVRNGAGARAAGVDAARHPPRERLLELLDRHIDEQWQRLGEQSKQRLATLAVSAGVGVSADNHAVLVEALADIAEAEGTLEDEREFAETYLHVPWVCAAIAEADKTRRRREQVRLAVKRHRDKQRAEESKEEWAKREKAERRMRLTAQQRAMAVDGEGVSLSNGDHEYRYMAACLSDGTVVAELEGEDGGAIPTVRALNFLGDLPREDAEGLPYLGLGAFGYGLGYDMAKWLENMRNKPLFELFHAADLTPKAKFGPFKLLLLGKCLQLNDKRAETGKKRTQVWDILKAFQSSFVKALKSWEVGTAEELAEIQSMKDQRGVFDAEVWDRVKRYCKSECRLLALLVERYHLAHIEAGIDLRGKFHGAGSTSDAFLMMMGALDKKCVRDCDDVEAYKPMKNAFSRAFFGGRAEVSRLGFVQGPVYSADIASAYPHALFDLPCVRHGKWHHVSKKGIGRIVDSKNLCCVRFVMEPEQKGEEEERAPSRAAQLGLVMGIVADRADMAWGPLPYRTEKGSIVFGARHPGGWAWLPEYRAAKQHFDGVKGLEAWTLKNDCKCEKPYREIGGYYVQRIEWGKEGRGKVLKLGMNGCYGKFAQVVGRNPKFACRVVSGWITASTRGRLVEAIASAKDPWNVFYAATDGLLSTERLAPPNPEENETVEASTRRGKGWLGSWEIEAHPDTLFVVQPGFYFSVEKDGRAKTRGVSLEIVEQKRPEILAQWRERPMEPPRGLPPRSMFRGVKQSILPPKKGDPCYRRKKSYGKWESEERVIKYVITPKRSEAVDSGDGSRRLMTWELFPACGESHEYKKDPGFAAEQDKLDEQPDYVEPPGTAVGE